MYVTSNIIVFVQMRREGVCPRAEGVTDKRWRVKPRVRGDGLVSGAAAERVRVGRLPYPRSLGSGEI